MLVANQILLIFIMTKRAVFDTNKIVSRKSIIIAFAFEKWGRENGLSFWRD